MLKLDTRTIESWCSTRHTAYDPIPSHTTVVQGTSARRASRRSDVVRLEGGDVTRLENAVCLFKKNVLLLGVWVYQYISV